MPVAIPVEITTVGAKVKYAFESVAGTRPTTGYTELIGVSSAPALDMTVETIDVSDLSDTITQYVPGRQDPGGDLQFTLNHSDEAIDAWDTMFTAAETALASKLRMWIEYSFPGATYSYPITTTRTAHGRRHTILLSRPQMICGMLLLLAIRLRILKRL